MLGEIGSPARFRPSNSCLTGRHDTVSTQANLGSGRRWWNRTTRRLPTFFCDSGFTVRLPDQRLFRNGVDAGSGDAPDHRAYETRDEAARPAHGSGRAGRTRTCFSVLPRHCSRLFDLDAFWFVGRKLDAGPGDAPGHLAYEAWVEAARPAVLIDENW